MWGGRRGRQRPYHLAEAAGCDDVASVDEAVEEARGGLDRFPDVVI